MATAVLGGDEPLRSTSSTSSAGSRWRSIGSMSFRDAGFETPDSKTDEEELQWAALERLPTYSRMRKSILKEVSGSGRVVHNEIDISSLGMEQKRMLLENVLKAAEEDNEKFLQRLRDRIDRVGIEVPKIEVRYENYFVQGDVYTASRSLPTLINSTISVIESILRTIRLAPFKKRNVQILKDLNGILKPSRMTLLLGPPGSGKTTMLLALAGKLDKELRVRGKITYNGHEMSEFVPQRTCAYISQHDLHQGELTVRETFDFSGRCLGVGTRFENLAEISRKEKAEGIKPDPEIDAFVKSALITGRKGSLITEYILKMLGLDICADTLIGDEMQRGISGGQKKRVTTGEMLVGPAKAFFMDEISTGLDSSTTFQIVKFMREIAHIFDVTMVVSLLQPAPETYDLFDDIILLSEGQIVYQGPRENVLEFFEFVGFKCPERKGVADFLQEVTSKKDQGQYWFKSSQPYKYISVSDFVKAFSSFHIGQQLAEDLSIPYDKSKCHPQALVKEKYGITRLELFKACFDREWLLMKQNSFVYVFKTIQITFMAVIAFTVFLRTEMPYGKLQDGAKFFGVLFYSLTNMMFNGMAELILTVIRLPVFYKQRDMLFYPSWAFALPIWALRIPLSLVESSIWVVITYYTIGFAPAGSRFFGQLLAFFGIHQMALSLFRFIASIGRTAVLANTLGTFVLLTIFVLGGFVVAKDDIRPFMIWGYYISPLMYGQNAVVMNEFLDKRWSTPNTDPRINQPTVGKVLLAARGFYTDEYMYWVCVGALLGFSFLFNILFMTALAFLDPMTDAKATFLEENDDTNTSEDTKEAVKNVSGYDNSMASTSSHASKKGMVLPFQPLSLAFNHINYYVDMPSEMKSQGVEEDRLQLLKDVSGAFRPGVLTALVGVSGAGKSTLMDVLAGRKTGGYIEGSISISGYPKKQETFARVSGYCEQNDIHSPHVTVYESLIYSAWLRLSKEVNDDTRKMFVEEVMDLVELHPIKDSIVGLPGINGLSTEQRKRVTIAVELVANPSIIFMDEPTSGLDARAAAIVMRTVRNTVDTGRTVVCTIHQPSIDIFEAFDELLLMKRGGHVIYTGLLGRNSVNLIEYFEEIPGVQKIKDGYNPATWMLDISSTQAETKLGVDFAEIYANSSLYKRNQELIQELGTAQPGSEDLHFPTKYSQSFITQCRACFWKQYWSYWRNPQFNAVKYFMTIMIGCIFGLIFWQKGQEQSKQQDLMNLLGAVYCAVLFLGCTNTYSIQTIVSTERAVFYRERAAGMYSPLPYAFAQVAIEMIYVAIQGAIYALLLYTMIGFEWEIKRFLWFSYFLSMAFIYFSLYGMMVVALTPDLQVASIFMSFFFNFWDLFSGFIILRPQIPIWWRWYYWLSPVAWTLNGLVTSLVGDKDTLLLVPGAGNVPLKAFLKTTFGFEYDFLPVIGLVHVAWVVTFIFVFGGCITFLNFQRR